MSESQGSTRSGGRRAFVVALVITGATLAALWPVIGHDFTKWDDPTHVTDNARFLPPTFSSISKYWTERSFFGLYIPVTYTAWTIVGMFAGEPLNPHVFHAANLVLHVASALTVFWILSKLLSGDDRNPWPAAFGALLFALHPLQVESVAWVSGFRDVFAGFLCLVAIALFISFATSEKRRSWRYALATLVYALALLSKPTAVVVPLMVGILGVGILRQPIRWTLMALAPWIVLAIPCVILTKLAQPLAASMVIVPLWERPLIALDALAWYLYKLVLPFGLAVDYGRNPSYVHATGAIAWTWIGPLVIALLLWRIRNPWREIVTGALVFVCALLPVLGLVTFDFQFYSTVADHYVYLAMLGPALAGAALINHLRQTPGLIPGLRIGAVAIMLFLALITSVQTSTWANSFTLFSHTLTVNPRSWIANSALAAFLLDHEQYARAAEYARRAIEIQPSYMEAHGNLGVALESLGHPREAMDEYRTVLQLDPNSVEAHLHLAFLYTRFNQLEDARREYEATLRIEPHNPIAHQNLRRLPPHDTR
jgi:hypothetical protein